MPQQQNGYDCGIYTVLFAEAFTTWVSANVTKPIDPTTAISEASNYIRSCITPTQATQCREKFLNELIEISKC